MSERKYRVEMTRDELETVTYCLLFVKAECLDLEQGQGTMHAKLFGQWDKSRGAYHTVNDVCIRAHEDYMRARERAHAQVLLEDYMKGEE